MEFIYSIIYIYIHAYALYGAINKAPSSPRELSTSQKLSPPASLSQRQTQPERHPQQNFAATSKEEGLENF